jgi:hypothetical protein
VKRRLVRWLERRRDAHFALATRFPVGSLADEEHMWLARTYEMLAMAVRW